MAPTPEAVLDALSHVTEPDLRRSIVELGMVRDVRVEGGVVALTVVLATPLSRLADDATERVTEVVGALDGVERVQVEVVLMTDDERAALRRSLHGDPAATAGTNPSHGHSEGRTIPFADPASKTRVLLIASGKGGVGKSSVTTNLAIALAERGRSVAVVDADVWGYSIPRMLGVDRAPMVIDQMIVPPEAHGVRVMSMGFFVEEEQPVIWRGPMLHKALEQFLTEVYWDSPDYLVIDLPPGTGDVSISLSQYLPRAELYVVTTPQPAAQTVAQRAAFMANKVQLDLKGVIENMSWFTGDDAKRYEIFGSGGGQALADKVDVPLLGQVPLVPALREGGDTGLPITVSDPGSEASQVFAGIAERVDTELAPTRRFHKDLKII